jgi:hypothetical protein
VENGLNFIKFVSKTIHSFVIPKLVTVILNLFQDLKSEIPLKDAETSSA